MRPARIRPLAMAAALWALPAGAVTVDWVPVGDPGNACQSVGTFGCFGAVNYAYEIGKYEVTNAQYAEFLNAVAAADPNDLYNTSMANPLPGPSGSGQGGIVRSGSPGSYTYSLIAGRENMPVNNVSVWDAFRFANWLHNGQPTGAQSDATTEDGAYTMTAAGIADNSITRNPGATIVLTSEDEWYKAAYYDAVSASYFAYPAGTDTLLDCATPGATPNTGNCNNAVGDVTDVGSYTGSPGPYGTFDQGGNVGEANDTIKAGGNSRGGRGAGASSFPVSTGSNTDGFGFPGDEARYGGFRLARIPEPGTALFAAAAMLGLAAARRRVA